MAPILKDAAPARTLCMTMMAGSYLGGERTADLPEVGRRGNEEAVQELLVGRVNLPEGGMLQLLRPGQMHAQIVVIQHNLVPVSIAVEASNDTRTSVVLYP